MDTVYAVRLTEEARANIEALFLALRDATDEPAARLWRDGLLDTLGTLPDRCPAAPENSVLSGGPVRQLLYSRRR